MKREAAAAERRRAKAAESAPAEPIKLPVAEEVQRRLEEAQSPSPATTEEFHSAEDFHSVEDFPVHVVEHSGMDAGFPSASRRRRPRRTPPWLRCSRGLPSRLPSSRGDAAMEDAPSRRRLPRR